MLYLKPKHTQPSTNHVLTEACCIVSKEFHIYMCFCIIPLAMFYHQPLTMRPRLGEASPDHKPSPWQGPQHQVVSPLGTPTWDTTLEKLANGIHALINYNALRLLPARTRLCREQQMYAMKLSREDQVSNHGGRDEPRKKTKR